ncbi:MAG: AfsA-related hotdog domain-containing protein [Leucobacter sp.]
MAHKQSRAGVMLADYKLSTPERIVEFDLEPGWACHPEWGSDSPREVAFAEALRQAVIAYAHLAYQVPFGAAFMMERMVFRVVGAHAERSSTVTLRSLSCEHRADRLTALVAEFCFEHEGQTWIVGEGHLRVIPAAVYRRMRGERSGSNVLARHPEIGSGYEILRSDGVVTGARYDPGHSLYFDHEVDHVPGMLLVAAAIELFRDTHPGRCLSLLDARFLEYLELSEACRVALTAAATGGDDGSDGAASALRVDFPSGRESAAVIEVYAAVSVTAGMGTE